MRVTPEPKKIVLVTPIWNDTARLGKFGPGLAKTLASSALPVEWVIADDGSCAEEGDAIERLATELMRDYEDIVVTRMDQRTRKGGAIYNVWNSRPEATWLAFVDGDGAINSETTVALLQQALNDQTGSCIIGVRQNAKETPVKRTIGRGLSFHLFVTLVHRITGLACSDTQCGIKVVPAKPYREISASIREHGFAFDVELLLALQRHGCEIKEISIPWCEIKDGKVKAWRDAWRMIVALFRIRKRLRTGAYR